jgi:lysophospholipase L1-like esterase
MAINNTNDTNKQLVSLEEQNDIGVQRVFENVIETIFDVLPNEPNDRKREQDRRRKFKDKLLDKYPNQLIVDSSYIDSDGKSNKQYTNTILVTETLKWWQDKIVEQFSENYTLHNKDLSNGHQVMFKDSDGNKFLSFSFYPSRTKLMVQGNHSDLTKWIGIFRKLSASVNAEAESSGTSEDNNNTAANVIDGQNHLNNMNTETELTSTSNINCNVPASLVDEQQGASKVTEMDGAIITSDQAQQGASKVAEIDGTSASDMDKEWIDVSVSFDNLALGKELHTLDITDDDAVNEQDHQTPSPTFKTPINRRRCSSRLSFGIRGRPITRAHDSTQVVRLRHRLDALDAILSGLQGGILKVVDSLSDYKDNTEKCITDMVNKVTVKVTDVIRDGIPKKQCNCSRDASSPQHLIEQVNREAVKSIKTLGEKVSQLQSVSNTDHIDNFKQMIDDVVTKPLDRIQRDISHNSEVIGKLKQSVAQSGTAYNEATENMLQILNQRHIPDNSSKPNQPSSSLKSHRSESGVRETRPDIDNPSLNRRYVPHEEQIRGNSRREEIANTPGPRKENKKRTVLVIGDSTTKLIDKRRLLRHETVSKCRAGTISQVHEKIVTGGTHEMDKIIICAGLNDLRGGSSPEQVTSEMKCLVDDILSRHPQGYIYICSMLPVNIREVPKQKITRTNSQLEELQKYSERVYYIDLFSAFLNQTSPSWELLEKDGLHPSLKGTIVMMSCIQRKIQLHDRQSARHKFISKPATPSSMSYANCVSGSSTRDMPGPPTSQDTIQPHSQYSHLHSNGSYQLQDAKFNQHSSLYPSQITGPPRTLGANPWWPMNGFYPQMTTPLYPQMQMTVPNIYPHAVQIPQHSRMC